MSSVDSVGVYQPFYSLNKFISHSMMESNEGFVQCAVVHYLILPDDVKKTKSSLKAKEGTNRSFM